MKQAVFFLLCCTLQLSAQESVTETKKQFYGNPFDPANQDAINMLNRIDSKQEYNLMLYDQWQPMDIIGKDEAKLHFDSANYHISEDKIVFVVQNKIYAVFPEKIHHAVVGKRIFVNTPYAYDENKIRQQYFEVLEDGEYALLRKFQIKKEVKNDHPMGLPAAGEVNYLLEEDFYFLRTGGRMPEMVPTKKKDFVMIFRRNRPQMIEFAKENNTSIRDAADLKAIFAYYNKLAQQS